MEQIEKYNINLKIKLNFNTILYKTNKYILNFIIIKYELTNLNIYIYIYTSLFAFSLLLNHNEVKEEIKCGFVVIKNKGEIVVIEFVRESRDYY